MQVRGRHLREGLEVSAVVFDELREYGGGGDALAVGGVVERRDERRAGGTR